MYLAGLKSFEIRSQNNLIAIRFAQFSVKLIESILFRVFIGMSDKLQIAVE
jgi:hypothetical protein